MIGRTLWNNSWVKVRECYKDVEAEDERRIYFAQKYGFPEKNHRTK